MINARTLTDYKITQTMRILRNAGVYWVDGSGRHNVIKNSKILVIEQSDVLGKYKCISRLIYPWAKENGIDLNNLSEEDKNLIVMKWG